MANLLVGYIVGVIGLVGFAYGLECRRRLGRRERLLESRIAIAYKNRVQMDPRLIDLLAWAELLDKNKDARGQSIYKMGQTTVVVLKPKSKDHGKTVTKTVKEPA